jgi:hypothetical protein
MFYYRQAADFITLLEYRRDNLSDIEASIEKCLMINRLIKYIEEVTVSFRIFYPIKIYLYSRMKNILCRLLLIFDWR